MRLNLVVWKDSKVARGIRFDTSRVPRWMPKLVEDPLVKKRVVGEGFVNSFACNIYHDGTEGLGQHFDDELRFKHPVVSLRLFSDSRLSFGCKLFACCNGEFFVDMPRGSITVLEDKGYAVNQVKHCIKTCDMTGRSGVILMRQIQPQLVKTAQSHCMQDLIEGFSNLGLTHQGSAPQPKDPLELLQALKFKPLDKLRYKTCMSLMNQIIRKIEKESAESNKHLVQEDCLGSETEENPLENLPSPFDLFCKTHGPGGSSKVRILSLVACKITKSIDMDMSPG